MIDHIIEAAFGGILLFIVSQWITELFIMPYEDFKILKSRVTSTLIMYDNLFSNPENTLDQVPELFVQNRVDAASEIRKVGSDVCGFQERVGMIHPGIVSRDSLKEASAALIGLSNNIINSSDKSYDHKERYVKKVRELLVLKAEI